MKGGKMRGIMTGMLLGGMAATMFGVINWQTERKWNQQLRRGDVVLLRVRRGEERNRFGVGEGEDRLAGVRPEGGVEGVRRGETARV